MAVLSHQRLLVVTGKGGVGKSAIAASLALKLSRQGQRTLVCEVNAKERISHFLNRSEAGPEIAALEENLWAVNVRPAQAMREYALMRLKFEALYNAVFENRLVRYFLRFIPSLAELVMLGKILYHLKETRPDGSPRFERIVIDAPATGHAITFLNVPQVILDTVPPGPLAKDAEWMRDFLVDPNTTAPILVALPEEMPVNETIELAAALTHKVHLTPRLVVLNGVTTERFTEQDLDELKAPELRDLAEKHRLRAQLSSESERRLGDALRLPIHLVPRLFHAEFGRSTIEEMADYLSPLVEGGR